MAVGIRGLINPMFDLQKRADAYEKIDEGFQMSEEAWVVYEALDKGDIQQALWQTFQKQWSDWEIEVDRHLLLFKQVDEMMDRGLTMDDPEVNVIFEETAESYMTQVGPLMTKARDTLDEIIARNGELAASAKVDAKETETSSLFMLTSFTGVGVFVAVLLGVLIANVISKPINQLAGLARQMAVGHLDLEIDAESKDEIGELMGYFGDVINGIKDQIHLLEEVSTGNLEVEIKPRSDKDVMAFSLQNLMASNHEQVVLSGALAAGDFTMDVKPRSEKDQLSVGVAKMVTNLRNMIVEVQGAADQVATAAEQISSSSQAVAEGAAEQASFLEETSASIEEITSMTRTNAENANQAQALVVNATEAAQKGLISMENMNKAIEEIKDASDETARIIKTIDDIAFQTNLLALNAAVEAARAGDAGRGFAVVAEEVRNLALRSAEAAKNTAVMIEESVKRADNGVKVAKEVYSVLQEIADENRKANEVVAEIAAASQEQARGIDQIGIATNQVNKVTQENAASAEESASGAEELASQVAQLRETMSWFKVEHDRQSARKSSSRTKLDKSKTKITSVEDKTSKSEAAATSTTKQAKKGRLIPLDDDEDFEDF